MLLRIVITSLVQRAEHVSSPPISLYHLTVANKSLSVTNPEAAGFLPTDEKQSVAFRSTGWRLSSSASFQRSLLYARQIRLESK
jgi:hypothetical protein